MQRPGVLRRELKEQLPREGDDLLILVRGQNRAAWRRQQSASHVLELPFEVGGRLVDPPVYARGPDSGIVGKRWSRKGAGPMEVLIRDNGLPLSVAVPQVGEEPIACAWVAIAEIIVVEGELEVDRRIVPERVLQEDVCCCAAIVGKLRRGRYPHRFGLVVGSHADAENRLLGEIDALVEEASLLTVQQIEVEVAGDSRNGVRVHTTERIGNWVVGPRRAADSVVQAKTKTNPLVEKPAMGLDTRLPKSEVAVAGAGLLEPQRRGVLVDRVEAQRALVH